MYSIQVVEGQKIVHTIEHLPTDSDDRPLKPIVIAATGSIQTEKPFIISDNPYE